MCCYMSSPPSQQRAVMQVRRGGTHVAQAQEPVLDEVEASGDIEELGTEDIDGVSTTHYRAVLDIEKMNA